jgi:curli production assembly/transport component CsgG/holdfast attachment protein HfaB
MAPSKAKAATDLRAVAARPAFRVVALLSALSLGLSACISPVAGPSGLYARPIGDAPVTDNRTPYSAALVCLATYAQHYGVHPPRIAVGRIADYTGKAEDNGGREITQGASLMAISALSKAGVPLVERYDTSVSEMELKYANNKLISDQPQAAGPGGPTGAPYRKILAGEIPGSDFYLVGGVTELNYNIRSAGLDAAGGKQVATKGTGEVTGQIYVMNVALDLRLVETKTEEVVDVVSFQKQIYGRQVGAGYFQFFGTNVINVSAGEGALEPVQLAVRSVIEKAVVEMVANLYGAPGPSACMGSDPLGTTGASGGFTPAYNNLDRNNGQTRDDPSRWDANRDPAIRGRY